MKDYEYYKKVVEQKYKYHCQPLSKHKFYELRNKILSGDSKNGLDELFKQTCSHIYDFVAHAFAEIDFDISFEDALQEIALVLYEMKIGEIKTIFSTNYFSQLSYGTSFKRFDKKIKLKIFETLTNMDKSAKLSQQPFPEDSQKINSLLQTPEEVAITELNRKYIKDKIMEIAPGFEESKHLAGEHTIGSIFDRKTFQEMGQERGVTKQRTHLQYQSAIKILGDPQNREDMKELLFK